MILSIFSFCSSDTVTKRCRFDSSVCLRKNPVIRDSPPAAGRFSDIFFSAAIQFYPEGFLYRRFHWIFLYNKKPSSQHSEKTDITVLPLLFICTSQYRPHLVPAYHSAVTGGTCRSLTVTSGQIAWCLTVRCASQEPYSIHISSFLSANGISL